MDESNNDFMRLDEFIDRASRQARYRFSYRTIDGQKITSDEPRLIVDVTLICQQCDKPFLIEDVDAVFGAMLCGVSPRFDCGKHGDRNLIQ